MGILDKLAFWNKKEDLGLGKDLGADLGLGPEPGMGRDLGMPQQAPGTSRDLGLPSRDLGMPEDIGFGGMGTQPTQAPRQPPAQPPGQPSPMQQPFGAPMQPSPPTQADYKSDKFEVVSAKLDSIRYTLESINQRLANLERMAHGEHEKKKGW